MRKLTADQEKSTCEPVGRCADHMFDSGPYLMNLKPMPDLTKEGSKPTGSPKMETIPMFGRATEAK